MGDIGKKFEELVEIVERLRAPDGCPWDREQTNESLLPYFIEEAYELIESVDEENWKTVTEELGDLLLHVVFQAAIGADKGKFKLEESLSTVNEKLVKRHPHVFGDVQADAAFHAKQNWEAAKHKEKRRKSRLDGVPKNLPALVRAQRLQQKASYAGFDWDKVEQVWDKIHEEILELKEAQSKSAKEHITEEIGDVLFAVVNLARYLEIPAEDALRKTNQKFTSRFSQVEKGIKTQGKELEEATLEEMDVIWNKAKQKE
ncbi:MAG: nucleoside triphosphate pyrophosphohydrolase [Candidatus Marinimicrobia bacterium]|jgi:MazG family protein|nr:nucleoside triphosphate pyrophosphohydrolase [Candidatus Neomarinimicrobiota bacterium]MDP6610964.1 nucleoside triphosphate pyrophosphohydrolase [Candidatus Neomarinimicrobiota bacterium]|tara:strand:+ start:7050 stop:7826 length:777 start_codon:yes stop_codon:yes gene_type:complete